jgi:hypothetical protein
MATFAPRVGRDDGDVLVEQKPHAVVRSGSSRFCTAAAT